MFSSPSKGWLVSWDHPSVHCSCQEGLFFPDIINSKAYIRRTMSQTVCAKGQVCHFTCNLGFWLSKNTVGPGSEVAGWILLQLSHAGQLQAEKRVLTRLIFVPNAELNQQWTLDALLMMLRGGLTSSYISSGDRFTSTHHMFSKRPVLLQIKSSISQWAPARVNSQHASCV